MPKVQYVVDVAVPSILNPIQLIRFQVILSNKKVPSLKSTYQMHHYNTMYDIHR